MMRNERKKKKTMELFIMSVLLMLVFSLSGCADSGIETTGKKGSGIWIMPRGSAIIYDSEESVIATLEHGWNNYSYSKYEKTTNGYGQDIYVGSHATGYDTWYYVPAESSLDLSDYPEMAGLIKCKSDDELSAYCENLEHFEEYSDEERKMAEQYPDILGNYIYGDAISYVRIDGIWWNISNDRLSNINENAYSEMKEEFSYHKAEYERKVEEAKDRSVDFTEEELEEYGLTMSDFEEAWEEQDIRNEYYRVNLDHNGKILETVQGHNLNADEFYGLCYLMEETFEMENDTRDSIKRVLDGGYMKSPDEVVTMCTFMDENNPCLGTIDEEKHGVVELSFRFK